MTYGELLTAQLAHEGTLGDIGAETRCQQLRTHLATLFPEWFYSREREEVLV